MKDEPTNWTYHQDLFVSVFNETAEGSATNRGTEVRKLIGSGRIRTHVPKTLLSWSPPVDSYNINRNTADIHFLLDNEFHYLKC